MRHSFQSIAVGFGTIALSLLALTGQAAAANCGGNNQRACKVWERIPSCNKGLNEVRRPGYCTTATRIINLPPPPKCGALGQKPCAIVVRIPSCDKGLVEDFILNQCVRPGSADGLPKLAGACYQNFKNVSQAMAPVAKCIADLPNLGRIVDRMKAGDVNGVTQALAFGRCKPQVTHAANVMRQNGLASMSLGISGEVGTGVGAVAEFFLALDTNLKGRAHIYESLGYKFGFFAGGSLNGVVSAHRGGASRLAGDAQAVSLSFKALGGAGFSAGFSYSNGSLPPNCTSLSVVGGAGLEANAGAINRLTTLKLQ